MPGCALWLVQVSGPGGGRTLARRGRPPGRSGGRGLSSYVRHNYWRQPLAAQLPAMSPGQLFVGDIGIALAVIDRGPLAWADISEVINLNKL